MYCPLLFCIRQDKIMSNSDSMPLYSWWLDTHFSPKNSKWLQENITDMNAKVRAMVDLIEEDADSFARRAEMYYKKRPQLIKLVEDFYRSYRSLAERYDHATLPKPFPTHAHHYMQEMERYLMNPHTDAGDLDEQASSNSEIEIKMLNEPLAELKAMKDEFAIMEAENNVGLLQYNKSLETISVLEAKITFSEENSKILNEQIERAEVEVQALRGSLAQMSEEKGSVTVLYHQCLEKISKMDCEILLAQECSKRLNREVEKGAEKLKNAEKQCDMLKELNQSLQLEAENLVQMIAMKDQELLEKPAEIERLQTQKHEEHSYFLQIESTLQNLQKLHSQSQQEQRTLAFELKYGLHLLKDLELSKQGFKEEVQEIVAENMTPHELNISSTRSLKKLQMEISKLMAIKGILEPESALNVEESNALQHQTHQIKDAIQDLNHKYQAMMEQLNTLGLNPKCFAAYVKDLQNENTKLKEVCKMERDEKESLCEKLNDIDKLLVEIPFMEFSLHNLNDELDVLKATVKKFIECSQVHQEEKSIVVHEKSTLLSELQIITEIMPRRLEKNTLLERSVSDAEKELESLKAKSRSFEESCMLLNDEQCNLLHERSILVSQLESDEARLGDLEKLEEKYSDVEKGKDNTDNKVERLHAPTLVQKEHANHKHSSEDPLTNLENLVNALQEEQWFGKTEFEEELDKAVNAQIERFILQSFVEDLEQRNLALLIECEEDAEALEFSDKVISDLEVENLMQRLEVELLLHGIRKFKNGIHQVCGVLQIDQDGEHDKGTKQEEIPISNILHNIEDFKISLVTSQEENQHLLVENSVLLASLSQHQSKGENLESEKRVLVQEFENAREMNEKLQKDKAKLMEINMQLRYSVTKGEEKENILKSELSAVHDELIYLRTTNQVFQEENSKLLEQKESLLKSVLDLNDALSTAEDDNNAILHDLLALSNLNLVYEGIITEKVVEQKGLSKHLSNLSLINSDLKQELFVLSNKLEMKETQNAYLNELIERMNKELKEANSHLTHQIEYSENLVMKMEAELFEMEKWQKTADMLNEKLKMEDRESGVVREKLEKRIFELSENCINHKNEIEALNTQVVERTEEVEVWEAEAVAFYSDIQILSISEVLLKCKLNELTGVCKRLDDESAAKNLVIEHMTERVKLLESEIDAYIQVITSLKQEFASLDHTSLLWANKTCVVEQKNVITQNCIEEKGEHKSKLIPDVISYLLSIQVRIRAVKNVMKQKIRGGVQDETRTLTEIAEDSNLQVTAYDSRKKAMELMELDAWRKSSEKLLLKKDIPSDHNSDDPESKYCKREHSGTDNLILELCENAQSGCVQTEINNSERWKKFSSELEVEKELWKTKTKASEVGKSVEDLNKKKPMKKKRRHGDEFNDIEHETLMKQIESVAETVKQLANINDQLMKDIEKITSSSAVVEQVRRGSEQVGRLLFEVQNIQYILLKLADEKNSKGKNRLSRPTSVFFMDSISIVNKRNSIRSAKNCLRGCSTPTNED